MHELCIIGLCIMNKHLHKLAVPKVFETHMRTTLKEHFASVILQKSTCKARKSIFHFTLIALFNLETIKF